MIVTTKGSICVAAKRDAVWAMLHDPARIAVCVPGCRRVTPGAVEGSYDVEAAIRFGPVRVAFDGTVTISDFEAPSRLSLGGQGRGGRAGTASGTAEIVLTERGDGCRLAYQVRAETHGPMTQIGPLFLTGLATALSDLFARRFAQLFDAQADGRATLPPWRSKASRRLTISRSS